MTPQTFEWIGLFNAGNNTGLIRASVVEWFDLTLIAEAMIDMTNVPAGVWVWKKVKRHARRVARLLCEMVRTVANGDGDNWKNQSPTTLLPIVGNVITSTRRTCQSPRSPTAR